MLGKEYICWLTEMIGAARRAVYAIQRGVHAMYQRARVGGQGARYHVHPWHVLARRLSTGRRALLICDNYRTVPETHGGSPCDIPLLLRFLDHVRFFPLADDEIQRMCEANLNGA